jgi:hypothetical protein
LETSRWDFHRVLGKFPNGKHGTQNESDVKDGFDNVAGFLFRAHQEGISRFELIIHKVIWLTQFPYATAVPGS